MSRLKAILTGGLPTFLDIGQSFSAAAISEDNLLAQMRARGMRVVVMGDDTWAQLAPPAHYAACHPYPAFDVRDLHTVDDGVWRHLLPYLRSAARRPAAADTGVDTDTDTSACGADVDPPASNGDGSRSLCAIPGRGSHRGADACGDAGTEPGSGRGSGAGGGGGAPPGAPPGVSGSGGGGDGDGDGGGDKGGWDVLVAHYLGVDHAGHTYGGDSPEMFDKLRQMDERVAVVAEELLAGAGGGDGAAAAGPYSRTLLLVLGDHGQTMSGDHGGGSDEERDSVLLAFHMGRWRGRRDRAGRPGAPAAPAAAATAAVAAADGAATGAASVAAAGGSGAQSGNDPEGKAATAAATAAAAAAAAAAAGAVRGKGDEAPELGPEPEVVPQIDLTPTLALLLGLPIPYGNLGKVNRRLCALAHAEPGRRTDSRPRPGGDADPAAGGGGVADGGLAPETTKLRRRGGSYVAALRANAVQVDRYLASYAARGGLPSGELAHCRRLLHDAQEGFLRLTQRRGANDTSSCTAGSGNDASIGYSAGSGGSSNSSSTGVGAPVSFSRSSSSSSSLGRNTGGAGGDVGGGRQSQQENMEGAGADGEEEADVEGEEEAVGKEEEQVAARYEAFLQAAGALARRKFTRFDPLSMGLGCGLMLGCVALHGRLLLGRQCCWRDLLRNPSPLSGGAAAAALLHSLGLFSANWIQGEGRIQCYSLAAAAAALWLLAAVRVVSDGDADDVGGGSAASADAAAATQEGQSVQCASYCGAAQGRCNDGGCSGDSGNRGDGGGSGVDRGCSHSGCSERCRQAAGGIVSLLAAAAAAPPPPPPPPAAAAAAVRGRDPVQTAGEGYQATLRRPTHEPWRPHSTIPLQRLRLQQQREQLQQQQQQQRRRRAWWRSLRRHARLGGMLAVALACNLTLQNYSLIDRWGSDPHDKRQLAAAGPAAAAAGEGHAGGGSGSDRPHTAAAGALSSRALLLAAVETLAPLGLLPALLAAALRPRRDGAAPDAAAPTRRRQHHLQVQRRWPSLMSLLQRGWRRTQWRLLGAAPFQLAAAWWVVQLAGLGDVTLPVVAEAAAAAALAPLRALLAAAAAAAPPPRLFLEARSPLVRLLRVAARPSAIEWLHARVAAVLALPLRLLLPRLVYVLAALAALQLVLLPVMCDAVAEAAPPPRGRWRRRPQRQQQPDAMTPHLGKESHSRSSSSSTLPAGPDTASGGGAGGRSGDSGDRATWVRPRAVDCGEDDGDGSETVGQADGLYLPAGGGGGDVAAASAAAALDATCSAVGSFTAVVALLLGRRGPAILLLLWLHGLALFDLLLTAAAAERSRRHRRTEHPAGSALLNEDVTAAAAAEPGEPAAAAAAAALPLEAAAGALMAALGSQAFFLTGHFCEFSGLQYDSPFVGFDHMTWPATPVLFWLNSFGPTMLAALTLPLAIAAVAATAAPATEPTSQPLSDLQAHSIAHHRSHDHGPTCRGKPQGHTLPFQVQGAADAARSAGCKMRRLQSDPESRLSQPETLLVALLGWRSLSLCMAVLNAAVQRHHVVVWALFAPKLVFEVCFVAAVHVALLLVAPAAAAAAPAAVPAARVVGAR
ncbi:hypothetical protein PLESTB_001857500 [Pleodorina starrii]|uniref:GPI ethanolamine phosphate transferase 3 n=1 Tax=Pleodorina starrii TaxID=330485 RepID=A0A9W6C1M0_9CHLO|nr:hypothetical protein PLESTB_001857500 [Pleodorina starrii]